MATKTILKRSRNKADSPFKQSDLQHSPVKNTDLTVQHVQLNSPVKETHVVDNSLVNKQTHVTHHVVDSPVKNSQVTHHMVDDSQVTHVELTAPQTNAVVKLTFNAPAEELTDEDKEQVLSLKRIQKIFWV